MPVIIPAASALAGVLAALLITLQHSTPSWASEALAPARHRALVAVALVGLPYLLFLIVRALPFHSPATPSPPHQSAAATGPRCPHPPVLSLVRSGSTSRCSTQPPAPPLNTPQGALAPPPPGSLSLPLKRRPRRLTLLSPSPRTADVGGAELGSSGTGRCQAGGAPWLLSTPQSAKAEHGAAHPDATRSTNAHDHDDTGRAPTPPSKSSAQSQQSGRRAVFGACTPRAAVGGGLTPLGRTGRGGRRGSERGEVSPEVRRAFHRDAPTRAHTLAHNRPPSLPKTSPRALGGGSGPGALSVGGAARRRLRATVGAFVGSRREKICHLLGLMQRRQGRADSAQDTHHHALPKPGNDLGGASAALGGPCDPAARGRDPELSPVFEDNVSVLALANCIRSCRTHNGLNGLM